MDKSNRLIPGKISGLKLLSRIFIMILVVGTAGIFLMVYIRSLVHIYLATEAIDMAAHFHQEVEYMRTTVIILTLFLIATLIFTRINFNTQEKKVHERTQIILDAMPMSCFLFDTDLNIIECNKETVQFFGLADKTEFREKFCFLSPELQPCGIESRKKAREMIQKAFKTGYCCFEWMHQSLKGEPIPCEIILVRVKYKGEDVVAGYIEDRRELNVMVNSMHEHTQIMLDAMPVSCILFDINRNIIDCNKETVKVFGLSDKKEFMEKFYSLSPQFQPCGRESKKKAYEIVEKAFKNGYFSCEWIHLSPQGERIPCSIVLVRIEYRGEYIVAAYCDLPPPIKITPHKIIVM